MMLQQVAGVVATIIDDEIAGSQVFEMLFGGGAFITVGGEANIPRDLGRSLIQATDEPLGISGGGSGAEEIVRL
ncbi:MAG: hypothetical protein OXC63_11935 [Aestuariivita sp.]|nr:hypothetical protein [Aestuariivita sp.]